MVTSIRRTTDGARVRKAATRCATTIGFLTVLLFPLSYTPSTQAQAFSIIHSFTGAQDGANPVASLTLKAAGNLYGTAAYYGPSGDVYCGVDDPAPVGCDVVREITA